MHLTYTYMGYIADTKKTMNMSTELDSLRTEHQDVLADLDAQVLHSERADMSVAQLLAKFFIEVID